MVNGKVYIGRTDRSVEQRWKEHMTNSTYYDTILYRAIRKYGIDNFYIETLEQNLSHEEAVEKEVFYIEKYRSYANFHDANGYNMTLGGAGGKKLTSTDKDFLIQKYFELRSTKKMAKTLSQYNDGSGSYIGRLLNGYGIPIYELNAQKHKRKIAKLDINTNEVLEVYDSIRDANISLGKPLDSSNIRTCLSGKTKSAYGYKWADYVGELFRRFQHWIFYSSSKTIKTLIWI